MAFLGDYAGLESSVGAGAQPAASKLKSIFQTAMKSAFSQKLEIGGALFTGLGVGLTAMNDPIEKAQATLRSVIEATDKSWDAYKGKVEETVNTQARFGHGSADTQEALGKLTAAYQDPKKALEQMSLVTKIAAFDHISLTAAAEKVVKMHGGAARSFKEFGINVADMKKEIAAATAAEKADTTAGDALTKAKQHLADVHAQLAGKTKLTTSEQITLRNATDAVAGAAVKANDAHQKSVAAQAAAKGATVDYEKVMHDKLLPRLGDVDVAQANTWGGRLLGYKTNVMNFVGQAAGPLGHGLTILGPLMTGVGGAIQLLSMFTGAHTAATAADTVAVEAGTGVGLLGRVGMAAGAVVTGIMTAAQWALNVAMSANPIGLVIAGIALLVAGFILAYQHIQPFRDFVNFLWKEIETLWHWIVGGSPGLMPALNDLMGVISTVINIALTPMRLEFQLLSTIVGDVWNALQGFVGFLGGGLKSALGAITGPIGAVGDALNAINPFAKHSPSLVENVIAGTDIIRQRYTGLSGMQLTAPNIGGIAAGSTSLGALSGAAAAGGAAGTPGAGTTQHITINNPRTELDFVRAQESFNYLATLKARGLQPPPRPAMQGA